jgi:steroid delta-isomerase-like uncharacterized protein
VIRVSRREAVIPLTSARQAAGRSKLARSETQSIQNRISALIQTLRHFNIELIDGPDDWKAKSLVTLVNDTLCDIFGEDSAQCRTCSVISLNSGTLMADSDYSLEEVRRQFRHGINEATERLGQLLDSVDRKEDNPKKPKQISPQIPTTTDSSGREKISLVTLRSKLGKGQPPAETALPTRTRFAKTKAERAPVVVQAPEAHPPHSSIKEDAPPQEILDSTVDSAVTDPEISAPTQSNDMTLAFREAMDFVRKVEKPAKADKAKKEPVPTREPRPAGQSRQKEDVAKQPETPDEKPVSPSLFTDSDQPNPFSVQTEHVQPVTVTADQLHAQIREISIRIGDLRSFDLSTLKKRYDPRIQKLVKSANATIADIFGRNTRDYWDHSLTSFEAAHAALGNMTSSEAELRNSYGSAIDKAVVKLTAIENLLTTRLDKLASGTEGEEQTIAGSVEKHQAKTVSAARKGDAAPQKRLFSTYGSPEEDDTRRDVERRAFETLVVDGDPFGRQTERGHHSKSARKSESDLTSPEPDSKEVVRSFFEALFLEKDLKAAVKLLSDDYILHGIRFPDFAGRREGLADLHSAYIRAVPDGNLTIHEQIIDRDRVVTRWTARGTHKKGLPGIPATNRSFSVTGITITRVSGGKIVEEWQNWDRLGLLEQLGAVPPVDV